MLRFQAQSPYRHVWRIWNFITDINEGEGDEERYKHFCLGRARAFAAVHARAPDIGYPAASAVGKPRGGSSVRQASSRFICCKGRRRRRHRDQASRAARPGVPFLVLAADICRSELLLEIEVVQRGGTALSA
ncbi:MAG: hypothetical protein IPJ97_17360 [Proteobacteria bacterium]|nr:hypothetical protein [Pseudomonadota bacterium]